MELTYVIPFVLAGLISFAFARWLSLLIPNADAEAGSQNQLLVLGALVLLLTVATSIVTQVVAGVSQFALQSGIVGDSFQGFRRIQIAGGVLSGTILGLALGIAPYVFEAFRSVIANAAVTPLDGVEGD